MKHHLLHCQVTRFFNFGALLIWGVHLTFLDYRVARGCKSGEEEEETLVDDPFMSCRDYMDREELYVF